jgi:hypothetical protein
MLPSAAGAGDAPYADVPIETVVVRIDGVGHSFGYRAYPELFVLDLSQANGARDTPYQTLLSYHRALAQVTDWGAQIAPLVRLASGAPGTPPADEERHHAAARQILSGDIVIHGEIHLEAYTIFITRYAKSIPRNLVCTARWPRRSRPRAGKSRSSRPSIRWRNRKGPAGFPARPSRLVLGRSPVGGEVTLSR